ncbi:hypothetical protein SDC9_135548 [bioreactor metagenome]|uniref:Uncharacterized protein n=1 Tax=bioreactor metagenome TaxID=1076179 RepID=A0A645DG58_9ZZZZ
MTVRCVDELELIFQERASLTGKDFFTNHALYHKGFWNAWSKVYRNDYLQSLNLTVLDKYSCEDVATLWRICFANGTFSYIHVPMISFRTKREGSITNQISFEYTRGYLEQMLQIYREVSRSTIRKRKRVCGVLADMYVEKCKNVRKVHSNYRSQLYNLIKGNKDILLNNLAHMERASTLYSVVGFILGFEKANGLLSE